MLRVLNEVKFFIPFIILIRTKFYDLINLVGYLYFVNILFIL